MCTRPYAGWEKKSGAVRYRTARRVTTAVVFIHPCAADHRIGLLMGTLSGFEM